MSIEGGQWHADGWEAKVRIGVLTPHADVGPESELRAMVPPGVGIFAARVAFGAMGAGGVMDPTIPLGPVRAFAEPPHVDDAAELLAGAPIDVIAFAFTSSAYVIGADGETSMLERLRTRTRGVPVVATCAAAVKALNVFQVERMALVDPPWFDAELNSMGRNYYEAAGFEVVYSSPCGIPSDQAKITPAALHESILANTPNTAQAVVIGGNGFRAVGTIHALERDLGRPVLTANQVLIWDALRTATADTAAVEGYGRLFSTL
jgi:maleate isomerase